ncbi:hypothetical protein IQ255_23085 [Pleurocapsales cyanobacterium LEGE 10410]|nr:hypothetical protein [Pleurocapsales cyanobacterium LEGE 10410]
MIEITYGYSRDHRADLKQFVMNLICVGDGDIPVMMEIASGNQSDKARFALLGCWVSLNNNGHLKDCA